MCFLIKMLTLLEKKPLYTIEFNFSELWPSENESSHDIICLDLWEPYFKKQT